MLAIGFGAFLTQAAVDGVCRSSRPSEPTVSEGYVVPYRYKTSTFYVSEFEGFWLNSGALLMIFGLTGVSAAILMSDQRQREPHWDPLKEKLSDEPPALTEKGLGWRVGTATALFVVGFQVLWYMQTS